MDESACLPYPTSAFHKTCFVPLATETKGRSTGRVEVFAKYDMARTKCVKLPWVVFHVAYVWIGRPYMADSGGRKQCTGAKFIPAAMDISPRIWTPQDVLP